MSTSMAMITLVLLLALNAYFVASEFAMVSARRDQIEPDAVKGSTGAKYALRGIENVSTSLAATQLGITACSLLIGAVGEPAIAHFLQPWIEKIGLNESVAHVIALIIALLFVTFLHMVLGEMVPKNISIASPSTTAKIVSLPLYCIVVVMRPVIWLMNSTSNLIVRKVFRATPKDEVDSSFTTSQVQDFVSESGRQGLLDNDEMALLQKALDFEKLVAHDVMMRPEDLVTITPKTTVEEVEQLCADKKFSRFPVVAASEGSGTDQVEADVPEKLSVSTPATNDGKYDYLGYVHVKDLLDLPETARNEAIPNSLFRRTARVDADVKLQQVVQLMQEQQAHFAVVAENDQAVGIVALEDVLEELVGEVREATA